ncbi:hypothetical protein DFR70_1011017 [Nocardia tenerifensis]|uniref:Methylamine utilisation protein MauE domain-containing protein n=1 Tax=Nocardia tenerifensis TaxID=228006 RepID=A0A318KHD3_9NOCA|nr:MauE/DoxX family redox-associated membrane protein [Nocardia tenerifensis]PXX71583.1 hypothetical protein DFR70_1011017 [Nocardia tenerifensis]
MSQVSVAGLSWAFFELAVRLVVGGFLIVSGTVLLKSVRTWRQVWLALYQLVPVPLVRPIGLSLPAVGIVAGMTLILGAFGPLAPIPAGAVLASIVVGVVRAERRDLVLAAGAFGQLRPLFSRYIVLRNVLLLTALGVVAVRDTLTWTIAEFDPPTQVAAVAVMSGLILSATAFLNRAERRQRFTAVAGA